MKNLNGKIAVIYTRVSTTEQKNIGNSLNVQKTALENFCISHNITILARFEEDFSAKDFNRPQYKKMKEFLRANTGIVNFVLVYKWDRLSRNFEYASKEIRILKTLGIEVNATESWIDHSIEESKMLLGINLIVPEIEREKIISRTTAGTHQAMKEGRYVKAIPIGYMSGKNSSGKSLIKKNPRTAPLIAKLFEDYSTGNFSQQELIKKYVPLGLEIKASMLSKLLQNILYIGKVKVPPYKDEPETIVQGLHKPIISERVFNLVQQIKRRGRKDKPKRNKLNSEFPLTGFLRCASCGDKIYGSQSNNGRARKVSRTYYYYQCNSKCKCPRYNSAKVHAELDKLLESLKPTKEMVNLFKEIFMDKIQTTRVDNQREETRIKSKLIELSDKQIKVTEKFVEDKIDERMYKLLRQNIEEDEITLKAQLAKLNDNFKGIEEYISFSMMLFSNLGQLYHKADIRTKKNILGSIFSEKLTFQDSTFRTPPFNSAISLVYSKNRVFGRKLIKSGSAIFSTSTQVAPSRIELLSNV